MPHPWTSLLFLTIGGALGTIARFLVMRTVAWMHPLPHEDFPLYVSSSGTIIVNAAGCLFFGIVWAILTEFKTDWSGVLMVALLTGFLGAFTTFSTFAFEAQQLYKDHGLISALGYWFIQNFFGLVCVLIGIAAGKVIHTQFWATTT
ncbi:CrcB family protein [Planctomycetota bacterium]|nr:CrcB family protein [Planctomycetota bacterium]